MKVVVVATHSFPIPWKTHTGDVVILDLCWALKHLGHEVVLCAPSGTVCPEGVKLLDMPCAYGKYPPAADLCELECWDRHYRVIESADIVHDFSVSKQVAWSMIRNDRKNVIATPLGGTWNRLHRPMNVAVWSEAMRQRGMRGASDYEGTNFHQWKDDNQYRISDAAVAYGGVDCELYDGGDGLGGFLLWMNRWHPAKGYAMAIEFARETGHEVVLSGEHPDNETYDFQKRCALEAVEMAKGLSNVHFEFLPADPAHHEKKREMYRKARALLYTVQFHEPFGLSQVEALASWTPVIGTRMGSVPEVINHEVTGFVCDNNVKAFAEAVDKLDTIDTMTCREYAVARFSRMVMAERYLRLYKEVVEGRGWG